MLSKGHVRTQQLSTNRGETSPTDIWILNFQRLDCEKIKPPTLWYLVMAALANQYRHLKLALLALHQICISHLQVIMRHRIKC